MLSANSDRERAQVISVGYSDSPGRRAAAQQAATRRAVALAKLYGGLDGGGLLRPMIEQVFPERIAVTSSFGAEAALTLLWVAEVDPAVPVIFLDTGKHFPETLAYRDQLIARLGLRDVRIVAPAPLDLHAVGDTGELWRSDPDRCCHVRKVLPLHKALAGFDAWITGRKRFAGGERASLKLFEAVDGRIKINPLADWTPERVADAYAAVDLPHHPLVAEGFTSIGCAPCTSPQSGHAAAPRAGRWAGTGKTECGIHWPMHGGA